ncbi:UNVERIFIED_CONTAM: Katanin p80 WD40 repeat-containing subunit B1 [Sesamum angustifolium]|uniref:Katanin p80 WD40 repeat-containing subunit B1 n=1 Tax=Sesamum angustifolium TaxID=2727405 RepID=A0AAW2PAP9_9LAMI
MAKRGYKLRILLIAWFCFYVFACVRCVPKVNVHVGNDLQFSFFCGKCLSLTECNLEEFVAHAGNVNCLSFGKKNCRVFITGGDDQKVNLWSVGKPTSLMSLCGHTSPVESAAFDSAEVLVVAGSSSGAIKLWDLEETKMAVVRGRTRSLVERFERKEKIDVDEIYTPNRDSGVPDEPIATPLSQVEPSSGVPAQPVSTPLPQVELRSDVPAQPVATPPPQVEVSSVVPAQPVKPPLFQAELRHGLPAQLVATPPSQLELSSGVPAQPVKIPRSQNSGQQIVLKEQSTLDDNNVIENLMQNHDVLLSTFRSRLTKLQVVRHFWERNDVKGAINAVKKLPDHSVQADVVGVLIERMEVITLDLFCCLLPVLLGLLDSKVERHASVSLEMLLKLVAVFGTVVRSTVSAPPAVGVDLHAEERSLESKIKSLEAEKQSSNHADYGSSQTESPLPPALNSDGTESSGKEVSKDEYSAGSFTKDTRTRTSWLCERHPQEMETDTKPDVSVSSEQDKDLSIGKVVGAGYGQGVTIRKRRGQRKRKDSNRAGKEASVGESDNLGSSNIASTTQKEASTSDCARTIRESGINNRNGGSHTVKRHNLMEIFQSVARSEPAAVFRHRMDSQKRARYRKVIKQHLDIGTIRSRIMGQSIKSAKELFRDLLLLANNALVFYSRRTREYKSALSLRQLVMKEYKQQCRGSCQEATSAFLPFNPPVKPRSARPRPRPRPPSCKEKVVSEKLLPNAEKVVPPSNPKTSEKPCPDKNVSLKSLLKPKKGTKRPGKGKPELADTRPKTSPVKQRKRVRK